MQAIWQRKAIILRFESYYGKNERNILQYIDGILCFMIFAILMGKSQIRCQ